MCPDYKEMSMDEKTLAAITALANKLGTTAEHLWGVLVKQAPYSAGMDVLCAIAMMAAFLWAFWKYRKFDFDDVKEWDSGAVKFFSIVGLFILGLITVGAVEGALRNSLAAIFNPEYWALKQLLSK